MMTPIYRDEMNADLAAVVESLSDEPVWIDNPHEDGPAATSEAYATELGLDCGVDDWKKCVLNRAYIDSYKHWRERGPQKDPWVYPLVWKRPDNNQVIKAYARAVWTPGGFIVGTIHPRVPNNFRVPSWGLAVVIGVMVLFALMTGVWIGSNW